VSPSRQFGTAQLSSLGWVGVPATVASLNRNSHPVLLSAWGRDGWLELNWTRGGGPNTRAMAETKLRALRVLLSRSRFKLKPDNGLVADDPRVVTGLDHVCVPRADLLLAAVVVDDMHPARLQEADVVHPTAFAPAIGLMHSDHLHPGSNRILAVVTPPIRTTSIVVLSGARVSSGASKFHTSDASLLWVSGGS
jgi:hypothetical protein